MWVWGGGGCGELGVGVMWGAMGVVVMWDGMGVGVGRWV